MEGTLRADRVAGMNIDARRAWRFARALLAAAVIASAACTSGTTGGLPDPSPGSGGGGGGSGVSFATLRAQAEGLVRIQFPQAVLIEVVGRPSLGFTDTAGDVDTIEFRFAADSFVPDAGTAWIEAQNGRFGPVRSSQQRLTNVRSVELPRTRTLEDAVAAMRNAGYTESFRSAVFRWLSGVPSSTEPTWAFELSDRYVLVGVTTGGVSETSAQSAPQTLTPEF